MVKADESTLHKEKRRKRKEKKKKNEIPFELNRPQVKIHKPHNLDNEKCQKKKKRRKTPI